MILCRRHFHLAFLHRHQLSICEPRLLQCLRLCPSTSKTNDRRKGEEMDEFYGYDPDLKLVGELYRHLEEERRTQAGRKKQWDSPYLLNGFRKTSYLDLFDERLRFEETNFTPVLNLGRRSKEVPMEKLIEEWDWQGEIEENLYNALRKLQNWKIRSCLKDSLVQECSFQLVNLTHAILCRGQRGVPVSELEHILARIVLRLNQKAFEESISGEIDDKQKMNQLFNQYIRYYLDADISRMYTIREWWYLCASNCNLKPNFYPMIELFSVPREISTLLLSVLIDSCSFKSAEKAKKEAKGDKSKQKSTNKKVKNWPHAFSIRDLAISELSPHVGDGEKTDLCKFLCVHPQLVNYYHGRHDFEHLHFPSIELPMKLPPRPWLDRGQGGPDYSFGQKIVRRLEAYADMDVNAEMLDKRITCDYQARPVFDALNILGATPWVINREMLGHMKLTLEMTYDRNYADFLTPLHVPRHPSTFHVPFIPKTAWELGVFGMDDLGEIIVDSDLDDVQNRELVLKLLKQTHFWKDGTRMTRRRKARRRKTSSDQPEEEKTIEEYELKLTRDQGWTIKSRFKKKVNAMYREKCEQNSLHCWLVYRLTLANHFADSVLYFPHNIDFRGRAYPISPQINHMGDDLNRGLLKFAKGKPLGHRGLEWLKLHCINITGRKKRCSLQERLKFAEENLRLMTDVANDPFNPKLYDWWRDSDEPWQTLAACIELRDALSSDRPEKFVSRLPIHQDGSCNGLQHYAAMGRDLLGARQVNLLPENTPQDLYSSVAEGAELTRIKDEQDESSENHEIACELRKVMPGKLERKIIKQTIMTTVYGVTTLGAQRQILKQLYAIGLSKSDPSTSKFAFYLTNCAFGALTQEFQNSTDLMKWLKRCAQQVVKLWKPVEWVTPLGLPVIQPYVTVENEGDGLLFRPVPHKQKNAFPPNFVHSLDSTHMMLTALHCHRHGITFASVHDCFWTHACDVDEMNRICREQFIALHEQPIMEQLSQFLRSTYLTPKLRQLIPKAQLDKLEEEFRLKLRPGQLDIRQVRDSVYFFS